MAVYLRRTCIVSGLLTAFVVGLPNAQAQRPFGQPSAEPTFPYDPGEPPPVPLDDPRMQPPAPDAAGAPAPASPGDIAVQPRGPVHEAFAQPFAPNPAPGPVVPRRPPDPIPEMPPDQKPEGNGVTWIPGYWAWDAERNNFLWVSGLWRAVPSSRKWVPGYWVSADGGYRWAPGFWAPDGPENMPYLPPPPASLDTGPNGPPPDDASVWAPGCWIYRMQRYVWRPGYWMAARPNLLWTPPCYTWTPSGYLFVDGYWDAPLADRGLLFAPVCFNQPLWQTPGWTFRPSYCIDPGALLSSLFVGPSYGNYYFGDYYGPSYRQQGFRPWFTAGRNYYNPLFSYYAWQNRGNPGWYRGLHSTFQGRYAGSLPRPPRTLVASNRLGPNGRVAVNSPPLVRSLAQVRNSGVRFVRPSQSQVNQQRHLVQRYPQGSRDRLRLEQRGLTGGPRPPAPSARPFAGQPATRNEARLASSSPRPQRPVPHAGSHGPFSTGPGLHRQPAPSPLSPQPPPRHPQPAFRPAPAAARAAPRHPQPAPAFHASPRPAAPGHAHHRPAPTAPRPAPAPHANRRPAPPASPAHARSKNDRHSGHR
jgi:hypothetical protein